MPCGYHRQTGGIYPLGRIQCNGVCFGASIYDKGATHLKRMLLFALTVFALSGCGQTQSRPTQTASGTSNSWAYKVVNWHNHNYKLTSEHVKVVGRQIGSVTNYSTVESTPQTGTFSNFFPVGSKLFSIPKFPTSTAFAVQTKDGYVKLVDTGVYGKKSRTTN